MTSIDKYFPNSSWDPALQLNTVYSNQGYKLKVTPDQRSIDFYGQIQSPDVQVNLHGSPTGLFCNWVGYFLPYPQNPFAAIPANIISNLKAINGHYWSCVYIEPPHTDPGPGCWRCAVNQHRIELNYGDLVTLTSATSNSFVWNQNNSNGTTIDKLKAESFTYTEQNNYNAIFIELDSTELPYEIGAFAGDSCVGATKVLPGDTTVLICAYTEGFEGQELNFEFSYETKAAKLNKPDYLVLNPITGKSDRRNIIVGDNEPYHFVSFKSNGDNIITSGPIKLNCYPNPATESFSVSYFVPENSYVTIEVVNALGVKLIEKQLGYQTQGNYTYDIQTNVLPIGYYFVRIFTSDQIYVGMLLKN